MYDWDSEMNTLENMFLAYADKCLNLKSLNIISKKNDHSKRILLIIDAPEAENFEKLNYCREFQHYDHGFMLLETLDPLSCVEKKIITKYFIQKYNQREISIMFKIHQSFVSRIINKSIEKLKSLSEV